MSSPGKENRDRLIATLDSRVSERFALPPASAAEGQSPSPGLPGLRTRLLAQVEERMRQLQDLRPLVDGAVEEDRNRRQALAEGLKDGGRAFEAYRVDAEEKLAARAAALAEASGRLDAEVMARKVADEEASNRARTLETLRSELDREMRARRDVEARYEGKVHQLELQLSSAMDEATQLRSSLGENMREIQARIDGEIAARKTAERVVMDLRARAKEDAARLELLASREDDIAKLQARVHDTEHALKDARLQHKENAAKLSRLAAREQEIEALRVQLADAEATAAEAASKREEFAVAVKSSMRSTLDKTAGELDEASARVRTLEADLAAAQQTLAERDEAAARATGDRKKMHDAVVRAVAQADALTGEVDELRRAARFSEQATASKMGQLKGQLLDAEDRAAKATARADKTAAQVDRLRAELAARDESVEDVRADLRKRDDDVRAAKASMREMDRKLAAAQERVTELETRLSTQQLVLAEHDDSSDRLAQRCEALEAKLRREDESWRAQLESEAVARQAADVKAADAAEETAKLRVQVAKLTAQLRAADDAAQNPNKGEDERRVRELDERVASLLENEARVKKMLSNREADLVQARRAKDALVDELAAKGEQCAQYEEALRDVRSEQKGVKATIDMLKDRCRTYEAQLRAALEEKEGDARTEAASLRARVAELETARAQAEKRHAEAGREAETALAELRAQHAWVAEQLAKVEPGEEAGAAVQAVLARLQSAEQEREAGAAVIRQLEERLASVRAEFESVTEAIRPAQEKVARQLGELTELYGQSQASLAEALAELDTVKRERDDALDAAAAGGGSDGDTDALRAELEAVKRERDDALDAAEGAGGDDALRAELETVRRERDDARRAADAAAETAADELEAELERMKLERDDAVASIGQASEVAAQLDEARREHEAALAAASAVAEELEKSKAACEAAMAEAATLRHELGEAQAAAGSASRADVEAARRERDEAIASVQPACDLLAAQLEETRAVVAAQLARLGGVDEQAMGEREAELQHALGDGGASGIVLPHVAPHLFPLRAAVEHLALLSDRLAASYASESSGKVVLERKALAQAEHSREQMREAVQETKAKLADLRWSRTVVEEEKGKLEAQLAELDGQLAEATESEEMLAELRHRVDTQLSLLEQTRTRTEQSDELRAQLSQVEAELARQRDALEASGAAKGDDGSLEVALQTAKSELAKAEQDLARQRARQSVVQRAVDRVREKTQAAVKETEAAAGEMDALQGALKTEGEQLAELEQRKRRLVEDSAMMQTKVSEQRSLAEHAQRTVGEMEATLANLHRQLHEARQAADAEHEAISPQKSRLRAEIDHVRRTLADDAGRLQAAETENRELEDQLRLLTSQLEANRDRHALLAAARTQLQAEVSTVTRVLVDSTTPAPARAQPRTGEAAEAAAAAAEAAAAAAAGRAAAEAVADGRPPRSPTRSRSNSAETGGESPSVVRAREMDRLQRRLDFVDSPVERRAMDIFAFIDRMLDRAREYLIFRLPGTERAMLDAALDDLRAFLEAENHKFGGRSVEQVKRHVMDFVHSFAASGVGLPAPRPAPVAPLLSQNPFTPSRRPPPSPASRTPTRGPAPMLSPERRAAAATAAAAADAASSSSSSRDDGPPPAKRQARSAPHSPDEQLSELEAVLEREFDAFEMMLESRVAVFEQRAQDEAQTHMDSLIRSASATSAVGADGARQARSPPANQLNLSAAVGASGPAPSPGPSSVVYGRMGNVPFRGGAANGPPPRSPFLPPRSPFHR